MTTTPRTPTEEIETREDNISFIKWKIMILKKNIKQLKQKSEVEMTNINCSKAEIEFKTSKKLLKVWERHIKRRERRVGCLKLDISIYEGEIIRLKNEIKNHEKQIKSLKAKTLWI